VSTPQSLRVWGRISSLNVRKVMWTAQYLSLPVQRIDAGGAFGGTQTDAFLRMNPNAMIPVLEDGDFTLWESNCIVRYLCRKHSFGTLYPETLRASFDAERWMDWQQAELNRASGLPFVQWFRTEAAQRQPQQMASFTQKVNALLAMVDAHLGQHAFMSGEHLSMADIPLLCEVHRWWAVRERSGERGPEFPHIERWYAPLLAHPASRGVLDVPVS
jgi:glutathione S-transferase